MRIKQNKKGIVGILLVFFLCLLFFDWHRQGYFFIVLPFIYMVFKHTFRLVDSNFVLLLSFGALYGIIDYYNTGNIGYAGFFQPIINFPLLYLAGKELGLKNEDAQLNKVLLIIALAIGALVICSVGVDVRENGFAVTYRSVQIIGDTDLEASATNAASRLIPLFVFFSLLFLRVEHKKFWLLSIVAAIVATICSIRIQSRSSIIIVAIAFLVALLGSSSSKRDLFYKIIPLVILVLLIPFLFQLYSSDIYMISRFQDSEELSSGHDRTALANGMIPLLLEHPFGGLKTLKYAHNLWLDIARVSGWFPLFLFLVVTIRWIKYTIYLYKDKTRNNVFRILAVAMSVCLFVYFNVEPILEGASVLFSYFCVFLGILSTKTTPKFAQRSPNI